MIFIEKNNYDMKNNKYQEEFSNYINIMSEALQKDDYKAYEYAKDILEETIEEININQTAYIKLRGQSTTTYPKKPYKIKFDKIGRAHV